MFSTFSRWYKLNFAAGRSSSACQIKKFIPEMEQLETRLAPATLSTLTTMNDGQAGPTDLVADAHGDLFVPTQNTDAYLSGAARGTIYEMVNNNGSYTFKTLYSFDQSAPTQLVQAPGGNLVGATYSGEIFELVNNNGNYSFQTLYIPPEASRVSDLIVDAHGDLFGRNGGNIFELANSNGSYTYQIVYSNAPPAPFSADLGFATLAVDGQDNLFGCGQSGQLFELVNNNGSYSYKTIDALHTPTSVLVDAHGNIFCTDEWVGGVYELINNNGSYVYQDLYDPVNPVNGAFTDILSGLSLDANGNLLGIRGRSNGAQTIFELVNHNGSYFAQDIYTFAVGNITNLCTDSNGNFFGWSGVLSTADYEPHFSLFKLTTDGGPNGNPSTNYANNVNYVNNLYKTLLHRSAEDLGLASWAGPLDNGTPQANVVQGIEQSTEFRNKEVNDLYRQYLHRDADPGGLAVWTSLLAHGGTTEEVAQGIVASPEYFALNGGTLNSYVDALYRDILGRAADQAGEETWLQSLAGGASRQAVAMGFLTSTERDIDVVDSYYSQLLGRPADSGGQAYWVKALQSSMSDEAVEAAFCSSAEAQRVWS